jgi:hydroxyacylglutathione hydrolase
VSYSVADTSRADEPVLLMTGGSLLVGAVGRTDLLGAEHAVPYARDMHHSLHEVLLPHEDFVGVYPTHGAGSLCSTGIASTPFSTVGFERRHNALLAPMDVETFARALLSGQPTFPRYFARMRPTNQAGPRLLGPVIPASRPLALNEVRAEMDRGALVVDARPPTSWTSGHVPGSVSIPVGSSFGTWLGWVVDLDRPTILILEEAADADSLMRQAYRIGHETVVGHLAGGFRTWVGAGLPVETTGAMTVDELAGALGGDPDEAPFVLDVRQASEFAAGHVLGARHLTAGSLPEELASLPRDKPIAVMCASGYRSSVAASLLDGAGFENVAWVADGVPAWQAAGYEVETGEAEEEPAEAETQRIPSPG